MIFFDFQLFSFVVNGFQWFSMIVFDFQLFSLIFNGFHEFIRKVHPD